MKLNIKIILLFALLGNVAKTNAQAALLALLFGDKVASESFHLTLDAGYNFVSMPGLVEQKNTGGIYFGLGTYIKMGEKWALTPEFKPLSPRGAKKVRPLSDYSASLSNLSYNFSLNYIDVPVLLRYNVTPKLFLGAGPQISFLTKAKQVATGNLLTTGNEVNVEEVLNSDFESIYFTVPLEIGYKLPSVRSGKGAEIRFRYDIGVSEMMADRNYGSSKGSTFHLFLTFPFVN